MQKRRLGATDIEVSLLGLGTVKLGRNQGVKYPAAFELPSDREVEHLLDAAAACGINLLDTAPAYGSSEERLGKLLKNKRHEWVLATKVGEEFESGRSHFDFSDKHIQLSIERSLRRLNTDYLDVVLVHSNGEDEKIIHEGVFDVLREFKEKGMIRAFGMSTKTVRGGLLAIALSDVAMVTYHPGYEDEKVIIQSAHEKQKGIFIKKALASGHLSQFASEDPVHAAFRHILKAQGVSSIIIGTMNPNHLQENVTALKHCCEAMSQSDIG